MKSSPPAAAALLLFSLLAVDAVTPPHSSFTPKSFVLNLDLPPRQRWTEIATAYKGSAPLMVAYITSNLPSWATPILKAGYKASIGNMGEMGEEMQGIAEAMEIEAYDVWAMNVAYILRSVAGTAPNETKSVLPGAPPDWAACTSIVAQAEDGHMIHGRNLDWNIDDNMKNLTVSVEFQKGGKPQLSSIGFVGFVGVMTAMKPGAFGVTMDARAIGGNLLENFLEALRKGAMMPSHLLRNVLLSSETFEDTVAALSTEKLVAPCYLIASGAAPGQGVVISRDRNTPADVWWVGTNANADKKKTHVHPASIPDWYVLETNYDNWEPAPAGDNRREFGIALMNKLGQANVTMESMYDVMTTWPVYNPHTEYTVVMDVREGKFTQKNSVPAGRL